MSDPRKPPGKVPPKALLDELSSIRTLLGDADKDVAPLLLEGDDLVEGDDLPVLVPEPTEGDAHTQTSLFDPPPAPAKMPAGKDKDSLSKALAERENPFLPRKPAPMPSASPRLEPTRPAPAAPATPPPRPQARPDEAAMRALVDEVLAEWMPKLERELRDRLMQILRGE